MQKKTNNKDERFAIACRWTRTLRTINLQGVRLEKLLISVCVAGVVAHVCGGYLGDVQWPVISKIL